jgi:hypothetical protein
MGDEECAEGNGECGISSVQVRLIDMFYRFLPTTLSHLYYTLQAKNEERCVVGILLPAKYFLRVYRYLNFRFIKCFGGKNESYIKV